MATVIRGGTVVTADGEQRADVLVVGETIAAVGPDLPAPAGTEVIDATGAYVMPGGIDPHTHMELPFMGTVASGGLLHRHLGGRCRRHHDVRSTSSFPATRSARSTRTASGGAGPRRPPVTTASTSRSPRGPIRSARTWSRCCTDHGVNSLQTLHGVQERHHV
jgi:hypothetical protein